MLGVRLLIFGENIVLNLFNNSKRKIIQYNRYNCTMLYNIHKKRQEIYYFVFRCRTTLKMPHHKLSLLIQTKTFDKYP